MRWMVVFSMIPLLTTLPARAADATLEQWGEETLAKIDGGFWMEGRGLYALETGNGKRPRPAWVWDASIQLGALCSAARAGNAVNRGIIENTTIQRIGGLH